MATEEEYLARMDLLDSKLDACKVDVQWLRDNIPDPTVSEEYSDSVGTVLSNLDDGTETLGNLLTIAEPSVIRVLLDTDGFTEAANLERSDMFDSDLHTHVGAADSLTSINTADFDISGSFSILYVGEQTVNNGSNTTILSKGDTTRGFSIRMISNNRVQFVLWSEDGHQIYSVDRRHYVEQSRGALTAVLISADIGANTLTIATNLGSTTASYVDRGYTNSSPAIIGNGITSGVRARHAIAAYWNTNIPAQETLLELLKNFKLSIYNDV